MRGILAQKEEAGATQAALRARGTRGLGKPSFDARSQGHAWSLPLEKAYKQAWKEHLYTDLIDGFLSRRLTRISHVTMFECAREAEGLEIPRAISRLFAHSARWGIMKT